MDHQHAMNRLRSPQIISAALDYAIFDRTHCDHFCDSFEIEYARSKRELIISEIIQELQSPNGFIPRPAFAYFPPKNELCDRRLIYIPLKDLVVRYGIAILFSEQIEGSIHQQCFANRRPSPTQPQNRFTEDFATGGWMRFCTWQAEQCPSNAVLLKADISSFYDSVSHEYLINAVCTHLLLDHNSELIGLLRKLLRVGVIYYSPSSGVVASPAEMHQGLPIGDGVEGFLANIYLKELDDAMSQAGAIYGRYVDDIRLFGKNRQDVIRQLRILQEQLLRKGLNLNASKTKIVENHLISKVYFGNDYDEEENEHAGELIGASIDLPFQHFSRKFSEEEECENAADAKDFCKFLGGHSTSGVPLLVLEQRRPWHVDRLRDTIKKWRGPNKHAAWLLVQTALYRGVLAETKTYAREVMFSILSDATVSPYSRYRILHHLIKLRSRLNGGNFRFIGYFTPPEQQFVIDLLPAYLAAPAFELNLIALETLRLTDIGKDQIREYVTKHCKPHCAPVDNALQMLSEITALPPPLLAEIDEPDANPEPNS